MNWPRDYVRAGRALRVSERSRCLRARWRERACRTCVHAGVQTREAQAASTTTTTTKSHVGGGRKFASESRQLGRRVDVVDGCLLCLFSHAVGRSWWAGHMLGYDALDVEARALCAVNVR